MLASVVAIGSVRGVEALTYLVPPEMEGRLRPGHRVLVPLGARRVTGIVTEVGEGLEQPAGLRAIVELLEEAPLFDAAHLELLRFAAAYYLASMGEVLRSVVPALARVESRAVFALKVALKAREGGADEIERRLIERLSRGPLTLAQAERLVPDGAARAALARLCGRGLVERRQSTTGHHRAARPTLVRLNAEGNGLSAARGTRQRAVIAELIASSGRALLLDELALPGASRIVRALEAKGLVQLEEADGKPEAGPASASASASPPELSAEQRRALEAIIPAVKQPRFETFLLWGVTASGKTEIYLKLAEQALALGRTALVLVPEIALAAQVVIAFRERLGSLVGVAHSGQTVGERWANWMAALGGAAKVMVGPRSAVFAPVHDLGLIVVDEEHDPAYKQEEGLRYNGRDLAVALGRASGCPVVLGSATPSAESFYNARRGRYRLLTLSRRVQERSLAEVEVIDLRREFAPPSGEAGPPAKVSVEAAALSPGLVEALKENLKQGGQSLVFLNRRGYHRHLQCTLCGLVVTCRQCSVSMTFHLHDRSLRCHFCGMRLRAPDACPGCRGFGLVGRGFGTERLVEAVQRLVPRARVARLDSDSSRRAGARERLLAALAAGDLDILVGTQMITKGFDFPGVTLVGVVLADLALNQPDFRSAERTFQLLTQVAGRAGRGTRPGRVLIQTFAPHHYSIRAARDQDYARFIRRELVLRQELFYPPYARLALVRVEGLEQARVRELAGRAAQALARGESSAHCRVLGPAPAPIERIKERYRWQVLVKSANLDRMRAALLAMRSALYQEAQRWGARFSIDIDPVNML
jgi:primosomal protein N' (replication factor Y)